MTMKKTLLTVFLMAIFTAGVCQAQDFTLKLDNKYVAADLALDRVGPLEVGIAGAVDYFYKIRGNAESSNIDVKIADWYIGPMIKWHFTPEDAVIDPYIGVSPMIPNLKLDSLQLDEIPIVFEAAVNWYITGKVGIGLTYQFCPNADRQEVNFVEKRRLMLSVPVRF